MINYILILMPLTALYLFSQWYCFRRVKWAYRGLLMLGLNGAYLCLVFGLAAFLLEVK